MAFLQSAAASGDLVPLSLGGHRAFLLNHPDYVEDVLVVHHAKFAKPAALHRSGGLLGTGLLTAEGELHRRRRRVAQPAFTPERLDGYAAAVTDAARRAQERWAAGTVVDMAAEMHALTLTIIGRILFSADLSSMTAEVRRAMTEASASLDPLFSLLAPIRRLRPARDLLRGLVDRLIAERLGSAETADDVLTILRREEPADGPTVTEQLRDDLLTLFVAGHDTIANGLTWTWLLIARHPEVEARLGAELGEVLGGQLPTFSHVKRLAYTSGVLAESLRLYPPSWVLTRRALEDHVIGGVTIPASAVVIVSQFLLHRDPRFFTRPLEFDPSRWEADRQPPPRFAYIPFGAGPRACIGQGLATMEGVLLLAAIAARWRCRARTPIACDARATLRPKNPVLMTLHPTP
jgi:cytochrome P450